MSESQPDHETDIQDLLQWIDAELKQSFDITNAPSSNAEEKFIPISRVESYFQNNKYSRTARLLQAVFGGKSLPVYPRDVAEDCCRVFCILARLGKTRFIATFVHCRSLWDNRLPFDDPDSPPPNFPKVTKDEGFYHRFYEEQWKFCVPELRERNGVRFEEKLILPFIALDREAGGNTSNVYRAVVHEKHDKLLPDAASKHCYAIKTYRRRTAQRDYERESAAFKRITEAGTRSFTPGIIGFYGSFEYRGSFNIILEYAEGGTLEHFFTRQERPRQGKDIIALWNSLFEVIKGIFWIHNRQLPPDGSSQSVSVQGWHQDLKPDNILVVISQTDSAYQGIQFKVADMGLSHFKTIIQSETEAIDLDTGGTRTYGAPECYAPSSFTERRRNRVKRSVDIWSLGCIYSEAAVWTVHGFDGVRRYRRKRSEATSRLQNFRGGDCFHDSQSRLDIVDEQHKNLKPDFSHEDYITGWILDTMVVEMLSQKPGSRPTAEQLDDKAERAVNRANGLLEEATSSRYRKRSIDSGHPAFHREVQMLPTAGPHRTNTSLQGSVLNENERFFASPEGSINHNDGTFSQNIPVHGAPTRERRAQSTDLSQAHLQNAFRAVPIPRDPAHSALPISASAGGSPKLPGMLPDMDTASPPGQQSPSSINEIVACPWGCSVYLKLGSMERHRHFCEIASKKKGGPVSPASPPPTRDEDVFSDLPQRSKSKAKRPEMPQCTLSQARNWYNEVKNGNRQATLPSHELTGQLENRDYVFFIDDSHTMRRHWKLVRDLAQLLMYMVKKWDNDGVDMHFLSSSKRYRPKNSTKMFDFIREHKPGGITGLNDRLNDDLSTYGKEIERWSRAPHGDPPTKRSIYILTDGVLSYGEDTQGQDAIKNMVKCVLGAKLFRGQVGIQFIRFGDDEDGKARLDKLDHLNQEEGLGLDVVDTEPFNGNVWKMLLGSINERFDDDPSSPVPSRASATASPH